MDTIKFKTNIKCGGCVATVTPHLDALPGVKAWSVDTNAPEKLLTVTGDAETVTQQVVSALQKAGFNAEAI